MTAAAGGEVRAPARRELDARAPGGRQKLRLRWWLLASVSVVLGATTGVVVARAARPAGLSASSSTVITSTGGFFTKEHAPAPSWQLPDLEHPAETVSLAQFRGRPLVINFWASWCPPCRKEMPALERVAKLLVGRAAFVGLDTQDERSAGLAFARSRGVTYPLASDTSQVWSAYGIYGLPVTLFVSADGRILGKQLGGLTQARLEALVHQVFGVTARQ